MTVDTDAGTLAVNDQSVATVSSIKGKSCRFVVDTGASMAQVTLDVARDENDDIKEVLD